MSSSSPTSSSDSPSPQNLDRPSSSDPESALSLKEKCTVCGKPAFCYNYGILSCNACKMFFRRVEVDRIVYTCKYWNKCYEGIDYININSSIPRCRACRFQRCLSAGMKYLKPGKSVGLKMIKTEDDEFSGLISNLILLDHKRKDRILNYFVPEDPTLREMLSRSRGSRMLLKKENQGTDIHEWSFYAIYASIELFLSLEFMDSLDIEDKIILIKNYAMKSMLLNSAMRSRILKTDRVMTPDGKDVYPDSLLNQFSPEFLHGIRSRLTCRLLELKITEEEHALLNMLFFCNSAHSSLSKSAQDIVNTQQKVYSSVLLKNCLTTFQQTGPSRFTDLLSIFHVINKTFEDVTHLTTLFQLYMPHCKYKKLFVDVNSNDELL